MFKMLSISGLLLMLVAAAGLVATNSLVSPSPIVIAIQCAALALMFWARMTFRGRSFHAAANPTAGGLVTTGPYHYIRHPIYTAGCLFCWAGVVAHFSLVAALLGVLLFAGGLVRMLCEEHLVAEAYPEYRQYAQTTKRMVPYLF